MPEMTVAAGGRIFKAFGSRAFLRPQWPVLNTLIAMNGYNGTILWKWPLDPNFMIHRNTMIATADTLYLGDATSCKLFDAATGEPKGLIRVPVGIRPHALGDRRCHPENPLASSRAGTVGFPGGVHEVPPERL